MDYSDNIKIFKNENIKDKNNNFKIWNTCYKNDIKKPCVWNWEYNVVNTLYETGTRKMYLKLYSNSIFTYYISWQNKYKEFDKIYKKYLFELDKLER
jgi:hypothetical protein